jgi:transcriptional regulator with XRE-family HTH domain
VEKQQRLEIGQRIRDLREASPETNRSIADYVGVGERSVANWIAGETGITYAHAKQVAELFHVDVRWLWDGQERQVTPDVLTALNGDGPLTRERAVGELSAQIGELAQVIHRLEADIQRLLQHSGAPREGQRDSPGP